MILYPASMRMQGDKRVYEDSVEKFLCEFLAFPNSAAAEEGKGADTSARPENWKKRVMDARELPEFTPNSIKEFKNHQEFRDCYQHIISPEARRYIDSIRTLHADYPIFATQLAGASVAVFGDKFVVREELNALFREFLTARVPDTKAMIAVAREFLFAGTISPNQKALPRLSGTLMPLYLEIAREDPRWLTAAFRQRWTVVEYPMPDTKWEDNYPPFFVRAHYRDLHALALLLQEEDPQIAITMLIGLLNVRKHSDFLEIPAEDTPDLRQIARDLYALTVRHYDACGTQQKLSLCLRFLSYGFADEPYWQDMLERAFALVRTLPDDVLAKDNFVLPMVAFYAPHGSAMQQIALSRFSAIADAVPEADTAQLAYISRILSAIKFLCYTEFTFRNEAYPPTDEHPLFTLARDAYWRYVAEKRASFSPYALHALEHGIRCYHEPLAREAAAQFIDAFKSIAQRHPKEVVNSLSAVGGFYQANFEENHKFAEALSLEVFRTCYFILKRINPKEAKRVAGVRRGGHGNRKEWRTSEEIKMERLSERRRREREQASQIIAWLLKHIIRHIFLAAAAVALVILYHKLKGR